MNKLTMVPLLFIFSILLALISVLTAFSFLGEYLFLSEWVSHARHIWCLCSLVLFSAALLNRYWRIAACALIVGLANGFPLLSFYFPHQNATSTSRSDADRNPSRNVSHATLANRASIKLMQMNLWGGKNRSYQAVVDAIHAADPDVIGMSEITDGWQKQLSTRLPEYPYRICEPHYGGIAIFSRVPLKNGELRYWGRFKRPRIHTLLPMGNDWVTLVFVHPMVPFKFELRNDELVEIAHETCSAHGAVILAGDLNCTPFSYYFGKLMRDGNLIDTEPGYGIQPTWNAFWLCPLFPIDHCLTNDQLKASERWVGPPIGSDHLPVFTKIVFNQ